MGENKESSRIIDVVIRLGTLIERSTGLVCVVLFAWMLLIALLGVFFRYVMHSPFQWTEEVSRYTLIWLGFTAINMAIWREEHIKLPFIVRMMPASVAKCMALVGNLLIAFYLYILLTKGYHMTVNTMMTAQSMPISMFWFYIAVPVSALLSLAQITLLSIRIILSPAGSSVSIQK